MLLLVTILLVLVAAVTLLIGIFSDNLALIFVSIGASALAAIVLAVLSQMSRRKDRSAAAATSPAAEVDDTPTRAAASIAATGEPVVRAEEARTEVIPAVPPTPTPTASAPVDVPIPNYDTLRVNEILPLLDDLDLDQLEAVAQREETGKNRTTVLNRIDQLMDELEAAEAGATSTGATALDEEVADAAVESIAEIGEPVVALADTTPAPSAGADDGFPIADYDSLSEDEVIARLQDLDADQLEAVADREEAGPNRDAVLDAIDDRLDILEGIVPAPAPSPAPAPAPAARKAPAKKATAAKKAPARKAATAAAATTRKSPSSATPTVPTRKAAAKKAASPAPSTTATRATATRATATATAKKAPAKAAAAVKAPAKKAAVVKKATPVKKATAAKRATKR